MYFRKKISERSASDATGFRFRGVEVTRLEAFSDAVFAFALALLVVSVDVPKSFEELSVILSDFPAFGATFAVLVWIWYLHVTYFRRFGFTDALSTTLNAVLLFLVLFYVYPLKFLFTALLNGFSGHGWSFTQQESKALMTMYSLGFVSVFFMFSLLYWHALRKKAELELNKVEVHLTRAHMNANLLLVGLGLISTIISWVGPRWSTPIAGALYSLIGPMMWLHWTRVAKQREML